MSDKPAEEATMCAVCQEQTSDGVWGFIGDAIGTLYYIGTWIAAVALAWTYLSAD